MDQFVKACVKVASDLCFDGWLVNIENKLSPDQIPLMILLLRRLTGTYLYLEIAQMARQRLRIPAIPGLKPVIFSFHAVAYLTTICFSSQAGNFRDVCFSR